MKSAVDLQGNPLSDISLAAMRRWLLEADVLGDAIWLKRAPVVDAELAERFSRDGADWLALGIEALAATARGVRDGCRK